VLNQLHACSSGVVDNTDTAQVKLAGSNPAAELSIFADFKMILVPLFRNLIFLLDAESV